MQQNACRLLCPSILVSARVLLILLFCGLSVAWNPLFAQDRKVTLHVKEVPLGEVVKELKKQTGKDFLFSNREVNVSRNVSVSISNMTLKEVLPLVFGKDYRFEIEENVVIVRPFVAVTGDGQRSGFVVTGVVTDVKKQLLPGVTVKVANTTVGTATNNAGQFVLRLPITKGSLEFSFVGFKSQTINFTENTKDTIRVVLQEDVTGLEEVQVIAYGSQKKRTLVSAVSSVKADDIKELPTHSLENLLQGHMAGVEVNNISGSPGGGGSIVAIRGYNSFFAGDGASSGSEGQDRAYGTPLYVIDGVPMQAFTSPITGTNTLSDLDPSMIESIEVLKDAASAAIYGSRAGNGVILITTKKGRSGQARFTANVSYSASWLPETPKQSGGQLERLYNIQGLRNTVTPYQAKDGTWKIPASYEEVYRFGTSDTNQPEYDWFWGTASAANSSLILQDSLNAFFNNSTDWWRYAYRTASVYNANIQASGGNDKMNYMIGAGYYKEEGIMHNSDYQRINVLTNISVTPTKRLTLDNQISLSYTDRSRGQNSGGAKIEAMSVNPMIESSLTPGEMYIKSEMGESINSVSQKDHGYSARYNLVMDYEIIRNLHLRLSGGVDYSQQNENTFTPSTLDKYKHWSSSTGSIGRNISLLNENLLKYSFSVKQTHNFDILLGLSFQKDQFYLNSGGAENGPNDYVHYVDGKWGDSNGLNNGASSTSENAVYQSAFSYASDFTEERMNSYFGRLTYNYKEKYMFETTLRRDGSSVFGEKVRWATFPSFAAGWAFSEESFMDQFYWLSFGKVRASWGKSGQKFSQPYLAHGLMQSSSNTFFGVAGVEPDTQGGTINRKLTWEETSQYDVGLDMSLFDYRFKFTLDYYYRYTKGQLNQAELPGDVYFHNFQWQNALGVTNSGIELELTADILRTTPVTWRMKFNFSRNWNRFKKSADGYDYEKNVLGKPLYRIRVYKTDGFYDTMEEVPVYYTGSTGMPKPLNTGNNGIFFPGTRKILDLNGDGVITNADMYYAESPLPIGHGGFINEIAWRQFDLNIFFTYSLGRHIINAYKYTYSSVNTTAGPLMGDVRKFDTWTEADGQNHTFPRLQKYSVLNYQTTGLYDTNLEKVNMLRLKQLTLGYNLHEQLAKKIGLSSSRVFLSMENLFLLTNYSGLDPEIVSIFDGLDTMGSYPLPRKFTIGLTVNF